MTSEKSIDGLPPMPQGYMVMMTPDPEGTPAIWYDEHDMRDYARAAIRAYAQSLVQPDVDARRYRWLRDRLLAADFAWGDPPTPVLVFKWPANVGVGGNCDQNVDAAIASQQEPKP